jgi:hypothetical protein
MVRMAVHLAAWHLKPVVPPAPPAGATAAAAGAMGMAMARPQTLVTLLVHADLKGALPQWINNRLVAKAPLMIEKLRRICK